MKLVTLRDGKRLLSETGSDDLSQGWIPLPTTGQETVLGRLQILSAQHRGCGCSEVPQSTKNKCEKCTAVDRWAVRALSRQMIRFTNDKGTCSIQARGLYAQVFVDNVLLQGGEDWGSQKLIRPRNIIRIQSVTNPAYFLDLEAVSDDGMQTPPKVDEEMAKEDDGYYVAGLVKLSEPVHREEQDGVRTKESSAIHAESTNDLDATKPERNDVSGQAVLLVPLGHDMSSIRRRMLQKAATDHGMTTVEDVFQATIIVISQQVTSLSQVSQILSVDEIALRKYIETNDIPCVLPAWLASMKAGRVDKQPSLFDMWHGDVHKRRKIGGEKPSSTRRRTRFPKNMELAQVFRTLAVLHQSCPLLELDQWKSYMFRIVSGRLMNLDFEITNDPEVLHRLSGITGFGSGSMDKIKEYLETGRLARIQEFETDAKRVAMKKMMDIWGVGRVKALSLVEEGYRDIDDVRRAVQKGHVHLDRNQLVGVDCYEDILEEMDRKEVEKIGEIVREAVQEVYPGAEVRIMGSYRRQKSSCGDVDVHITHKSYPKRIPEQGLSQIVDLLWNKGHLLFHLTFFSGMKTGRTAMEYMRSSRHIPEEAFEGSKVVGYMTSRGQHGSSYMGVMASPKISGKRRRVDLKFYPYRERIFAALYFTGNGFFNRSMRLWASLKFRYTLNDHGLFHLGTNDRVMEAENEIEVFDKLRLVYKEPHERDCFDAVESKDANDVYTEMSHAQFLEDKQYVWVN